MSILAAVRQQAGMTRGVVRVNMAGVTHEGSLAAPRPAGNSLNWVLGHLLWVYNDVLGLLGATPVADRERLQFYARGSTPVAAADALPLDELVRLWDAACGSVEAVLAEAPEARLAEPVPNSPSGNPDETVGSLLVTILFHQAYHAGQLGVLRRVAGHPGAIA